MLMRPRSRIARFSPLSLVLAIAFVASPGLSGTAIAQDAAAEQTRFFEAEIRPLLVQHCIKCHGPEKQKGGLRLDSREAILTGGESGPAVEPGKPGESLLVEAVNYDGLEMPPTGKLADAPRAAIAKWVAMGAPWPETRGASGTPPVSGTAAGKPRITDEDRAFWSFQPLKRPAVPNVEDAAWSQNPIDRFLFARLHKEGLTPAPEADRRTLIRRLSFDLTGLPPTPAEVEAFVADDRADAYERLVDRLLASPRYGERWGRHWLDLVRYAESDGYRQDAYRADAWRYRDYVIDAFNRDKPYDRFVTEQLAGDEVAPEDPEMRVAVGYLRLTTYEFNQRDVVGQWSAILNDITDVTGDVFLGLGIGCARCHDHKFDPILQRDYFRLQAFFTPILPRDDLDLVPASARPEFEVKRAAWESQTAELRKSIAELERKYRKIAEDDAIAKFPDETKAILAKPKAERTPLEEQLAQLAYRQVTEEHNRIGDRMKKSKEKDRWEPLMKEMARLESGKPATPAVLTVTDVGPTAPPTMIPGDRSRTPIEPGFLTILDPTPAKVEPLPTAPKSTGRRTALAKWLTRPDNPLSTRVIVNRVWQYHFGRGLVGTSSDFGRLGEAPSHPELLDWLATEFASQGWSLKNLHRLVLNTAAYRQSSRHPAPAKARKLDPENRLIWRAPTRRLDVEPVRDAMLAVTGELERTIGGPAVEFGTPRRTIYAKVVRNTRDPLSEAFDAPDGLITTPQRNATVTAVQSLLMINGKFALDRARAFARRLTREAETDEARVDLAYRLAFGRPPESTEPNDALTFLNDQARRAMGREEADAGAAESDGPAVTPEARAAALVDFCHALLNASEFLYVD